jgi:hypothetical protein
LTAFCKNCPKNHFGVAATSPPFSASVKLAVVMSKMAIPGDHGNRFKTELTQFLAELAVSNHKAQMVPANPEQRLKRLRRLLHTVGRVRREDCLTDRLALDRERHAFQLERKFPNGAARETTSCQ